MELNKDPMNETPESSDAEVSAASSETVTENATVNETAEAPAETVSEEPAENADTAPAEDKAPEATPDKAEEKPLAPKSKKKIAIIAGIAVAAVAVIAAVLIVLLGGHKHTPGEAEFENQISSTCTTAGSYDKVVYCLDCGEVLSSEKVTVPAIGHKGGTATCTSQAVCTECNEKYGDVKSHDYADATCTAPKTCKACGATEGEAKSHSISTSVVDPTCTESGYTVSKCTNEGCTYENRTDYTAALDHKWSEPTCEHDRECERCDATQPKLKCDYVKVASTDATCTAAATETYKCSYCNDSYTNTVGAALNHDISGVAPVEVLVDGCTYKQTFACKREGCGATVDGETFAKHTLKASITREATCSVKGEKTLACAKCDYSEKEDIPENTTTGHNWELGTPNGNKRVDTCSGCGKTKTVTVYTGSDTGSTKAENFKDAEIELNGTNISMDSGVVDSIGDKDVTLSAGKLEGDDRLDLGLDADKLAQVGDSPIYNFTITDSANQAISNFGENNYVTITLPYTLSEGEDVDNIAVWFIADNGELESIKAEYNNGYVTFKTNHFSYYTVTRLTPAERCELYGHNFAEKIVAPTCTADGYTLKACARCHYTENTDVVAAIGHSFITDETPATCTENGKTVSTCANCQATAETVIPALGHAFSETSRTDATCEAAGEIVYTCANCSDSYTEKLPQLGHSFSAEVTAPTCENAGYTTHKCANCETSYVSDETPAIGHDYTVSFTWAEDKKTATANLVCKNDAEHKSSVPAEVSVNVIEATCSGGTVYEYTATVTVGGKLYTDMATVTEGEPSHSFSTEWKKNETTHWHECTCGAKSELASHDYGQGTVTTEPTCTEAGVKTYTCVCGDTKTEVIPAAGAHNYEKTAHTDATCSAKGSDVYTCSACGDSYSEDIPMVAHELTETVVAPTCDSTGYTLNECANCDFEEKSAETAALGHSYTATFEWAEDYSAAEAKLVCANDETHTLTLNAAISEKTEEATCYGGKVTKYTATVIEGEKTFTDEKIISDGEPNHTFGTEWKSDGTKHWHECVCGEKSAVADHAFNNGTVTKAPTCKDEGIKTYTCECGKKKTEAVPTTNSHDYVDGICKICGAEFTEAYYVNLVNSWKNINGFAIKLQNLSFEIKEQDNTLAEKLKLIGSIKQLDITELALYVEDGELGGAAIGSIVIYNGPISNGNAVYEFKAVINDGYVYISVKYGQDKANKTLGIKMSTDALLDSLFENTSLGEESFSLLEFAEENIIPLIDNLIETNSDDVNVILEKVFNIIFTLEQKSDGTYVATLDYDKLYELNDNLATKSVAEVIDIYFGEGTFDGIVDTVLEILDLEFSEIPEYLDENGIDSADLIEKINAFAKETGAPNDFDIEEFLNSDELAGVTVGMLIFELEDDSYVDMINDIVNTLRENSLYELIDPESKEDIKDGIESIIDLISDSISISFTTDKSGMLTSVSIDADGFTIEQEGTEITASLNLDITVNGKINVTWSNIIKEIESTIVLPEDDMLEDGVYSYYYEQTGYVTYKGEEYYYEDGICINVYEPMYDKLSYIIFQPDCNGWTYYDVAYAETEYRFLLAEITVDGKDIMIIIDENSGETAEITQAASGYKMTFIATFEDGTKKSVSFDLSEDDIDESRLYAELCLGIFENAKGVVSAIGYYTEYYYNAKLNEYSYESHHNIERTYEMEGDDCEDGYYVTERCTVCGINERYYRTGHSTTHTEIELNTLGLCGGYISENYCEICEDVVYSYVNDYDCNWRYVETNEDGYEVYRCTRCSTTKWYKQSIGEKDENCEYIRYVEYKYFKNGELILESTRTETDEAHNYEYSFTFIGDSHNCEDGVEIYRVCLDCGYTSSYGSHWHEVVTQKTIDVGAHGGCEGTIQYQACACGQQAWISLGTSCKLQDSYDSYIENGVTYHVSNNRCAACGLTYQDIYYDEIDKANCRRTTHHSLTIKIGNTLIDSFDYDQNNQHHDNDVSYELNGDSCEDGYKAIYTCKTCGYKYIMTGLGGHPPIETERYDLENYGSACGGYLILSTCPCGERRTVRFDSFCKFDQQSIECWVENAVYGWHNDEHYNFDFHDKVCSVTSPDCNLTIRFARCYVPIGDCLVEEVEIYLLGYNEQTGEYMEKVEIRTGNIKSYHPFTEEEISGTEEGFYVSGTRYTCKCGSYHMRKSYFLDEYGKRVVKEITERKNTNATDDMQSYLLSIHEYDENGHETYWYTEVIYANGTKTTDEYNYVIYNNRTYTKSSYAYRLYEYGEEWWNKYEYSYDFTNGCVAYVTFTSSYGDYDTYTENCHHITWGYVKTPTCTQSGIRSHYCIVCGYYDEAEEIEPTCHDWQYDDYKNTFVCACCGLENANGASGDIVMEDLTAQYGNGDFYVVGYYVRSNASFGKYIDVLINGELITLDETKIGILDHDTARAYLISKADIEAQLKELGYADAEYNVVFTFVPDDAIGNLDYAITFSNDYLAPDVKEISGNATVSVYTENGKTVDYTIIVEKKSEWIFESFASSDTRVYLYRDKFQVENDDGGLNNNFRLSVVLDPGVYTLSVRWFSSDTSGHFSFTATKNDIEEETCNHILNDTPYKWLMDKKTGCIPSDTPGIKAFADMPFDDYKPGEIIKAYFVCEICGEVITCNVIIV